MTWAFQTKIPEFQRNSPLRRKMSARALSGYSVKVFTFDGTFFL